MAAVPSFITWNSYPVLTTPVSTEGCCTFSYYLELLPCTLNTGFNRWLPYILLLPGTPTLYSHHWSQQMAAVHYLITWNSYPVLSSPVSTDGCCTFSYYLELLPCTLITGLNRWLLYILLLPGTPTLYSYHRSQQMAAVPSLCTHITRLDLSPLCTIIQDITKLHSSCLLFCPFQHLSSFVSSILCYSPLLVCTPLMRSVCRNKFVPLSSAKNCGSLFSSAKICGSLFSSANIFFFACSSVLSEQLMLGTFFSYLLYLSVPRRLYFPALQ